MPSPHGPIFYCRQKIGVKIGLCASTFVTFPTNNVSVINKKSDGVHQLQSDEKKWSDIIQQWGLAYHFHRTITLIKIGPCAPNDRQTDRQTDRHK